MSTLLEIESAVDALPAEQKQQLYQYLTAQLTSLVPATGHSVLDIAPVHLGSVLRPLTRDDDLLEEMLEGRP